MEDVNMLKTLAKEIRQYKKATVLAPVFTGFEVLMEILIPFVTASIIDQGIEAGNISVWRNHADICVYQPDLRRSGRTVCGFGIDGLCLQSA